MATNIMAVPLAQMKVQTGNNEDWIDSILFLVAEDPPVQLDLRGISFELEIRRNAADHEVILSASTDDGTIAVGPPPNFGYLLINVPLAVMKTKFAGEYVGDIRARADNIVRVIIQFTRFAIIEGVTKSP